MFPEAAVAVAAAADDDGAGTASFGQRRSHLLPGCELADRETLRAQRKLNGDGGSSSRDIPLELRRKGLLPRQHLPESPSELEKRNASRTLSSSSCCKLETRSARRASTFWLAHRRWQVVMAIRTNRLSPARFSRSMKHYLVNIMMMAG